MSIQAAQLVARVAVEGDVETKAKLDSVGKKVDDTSKGFRDKLGNDLKLGMMAAGASVAALGVEAVKLAGSYNSGLTTLVTGAGELPKNLGMVHDKMLQISTDTGTMTDSLVAGEFLINSAGQKGSQALQTLRDSAEGAKVGAASLADVANGVTTEMTDYAKAHLTSAQATNTLIAATADGKTHLGELSVAMAAVLPTAAAVGVQLNDVAGAMATMTGEGTPAADSATYLRQMLLALEVPGSKAVKTFQEIGLTSAQIAAEMKKSLPDTLQLIVDHLSKKFPVGSAAYVDALKNMAGGQKNFQAWLELTGPHLTDFKNNVGDITQKVKEGGNSIVGWTDVQKDFNFQLDVAHAAFNAVLIKVGEQLMPVLSQFLKEVVMPAITNFQDWATHTNTLHDAFQTVVNVVGDLITGTQSVVSWFQQAGPQGTALKDVLIAVGIAVGTVKFAALAGDVMNMVTVVIPQALVQFGLMEGGLNTLAGSEVAATTAADGLKASLGPLAVLVAGVTLGLSNMADAQNQYYTADPLDPNNVVTKQDAQATLDRLAREEHARNMQRLQVANKSVLDTMQTDYANYTANLQKNQSINDTLMIQNGLETQQQRYALQQQYGRLMLEDAQKTASGQKHLDDINNYNLLTGTAYYWTGEISATQTGTNTNYQIVKAGYQKSADTVASKMQEVKDAVASKWSQINNDQKSAAAHSQEIIRSGFQSAADDTAAQMEKMRKAVQSKWDQINNIMSHQIVLNVDTVFSQSGAKPVVPNAAHATGILNNPVGHYAKLAEEGGEWMHIPNPTTGYVPVGASVLPHGVNPGSLLGGFGGGFSGGSGSSGGQPQPINITLMCDGFTLARIMTEHQAGILRTGLGIIGV